MAVTINGTTGIAGVDGSASTPAVQGTDTNTGIFFPAADTIAFGEGGAESARLNADAQFVSAAGTASLPVLTTTGDLNTGVFYPAADTVAWTTGGTERMRINANGRVGIGVTPAAWESSSNTNALQVKNTVIFDYIGEASEFGTNYYYDAGYKYIVSSVPSGRYTQDNGNHRWLTAPSGTAGNAITFTERMRLTSGGDFLVAKTAADAAVVGCELRASGVGVFTANGTNPLTVNRTVSDGNLVVLQQDGTTEGTISVSGTTVSYNGGNLARYAQLTVPKDETNLLKGTVMSNLDEMNVYTDAEGNPVPNEQLNKVKVSDVESDVNVAGVFVNWSYDEAHQVDEINMAMTGDMIIRIAQGVVVQKGDLLMSAGDGTAKPQGDDIIRSKTVAKVTSNHVTCTYEDGSYCVPCVLMAC